MVHFGHVYDLNEPSSPSKFKGKLQYEPMPIEKYFIEMLEGNTCGSVNQTWGYNCLISAMCGIGRITMLLSVY